MAASAHSCEFLRSKRCVAANGQPNSGDKSLPRKFQFPFIEGVAGLGSQQQKILWNKLILQADLKKLRVFSEDDDSRRDHLLF